MKVTAGYDRMLEIIKEMQAQTDIVDILEQGCGDGYNIISFKQNEIILQKPNI